MALTIAKTSNGVTITFDGSTPWLGSTINAEGLEIASIQMIPTATDDVLTVRESGSATGRKIFYGIAANAYDIKSHYFDGKRPNRLHDLYVVGAEASSGVQAIIEFK